MHIRTVTKRMPDAAQTDVMILFLDVVSAILGIAAQINALVVNVRTKSATT
jgi:hypothetical protein